MSAFPFTLLLLVYLAKFLLGFVFAVLVVIWCLYVASERQRRWFWVLLPALVIAALNSFIFFWHQDVPSWQDEVYSPILYPIKKTLAPLILLIDVVLVFYIIYVTPKPKALQALESEQAKLKAGANENGP